MINLITVFSVRLTLEGLIAFLAETCELICKFVFIEMAVDLHGAMWVHLLRFATFW